MSFSQRLLDLSARETGADLLGKIGKGEAELGSLRYVLLKLRKVHLVVGIGDGMVVLQIIRFLLIGDERRHAFQHEIEMVGAPLHIGFQFSHAKLPERSSEALGGIEHIFAAAVSKTRGLARAGIINNDSGSIIEFGAVRDGIGARSE